MCCGFSIYIFRIYRKIYIFVLFLSFFMFEEKIKQKLLSGDAERSFTDKLFAKEDVARIRELFKKTGLTRSEINELMYMCTGVESKLVNFGEYDRYVVLKFYVWIQTFEQINENLYDFYELEKSKREGVKKYWKDVKDGVDTDSFEPPEHSDLSEKGFLLLETIIRGMEHSIKNVVALYLNIVRTSLSLGATGFLEPLKQKFEMTYPTQEVVSTGGEGRRTWFGGTKK